MDRQINRISGNLIYYLNYDKLTNIKDDKLGIRIIARLSEGFAHYSSAEFHSNTLDLQKFLRPNERVMINIILERRIDYNTFVIEKIGKSKSENGSFKYRKESGVYV